MEKINNHYFDFDHYGLMPAAQGWQCPICKRIYSPTTIMCPFCGGAAKTIDIKFDWEGQLK